MSIQIEKEQTDNEDPLNLLREGKVDQYLASVGHMWAGNGQFGVWNKELEQIGECGRFYREHFIDWAVSTGNHQGELSFIDAGCGNGSISIPLSLHFALSIQCPVQATLIDLQSEGISQAKESLVELNLPDNLRPNLVIADLEEVELQPNSVDVVLLRNVIHWVDPEKASRVIAKYTNALRSGGRILIDVCSLYNAASIGMEDRALFDEMLAATSNAVSDVPYAKYRDRYGKWMYFYTPKSLLKLTDNVGLREVALEEYHNETYPNGWGQKYPENIRAIFQKSEV